MSEKTSKDNLEDRMKELEGVEAQRKLDPSLPILVRLDGRSFHSFTRQVGFQRPFDEDFHYCMKAAAKAVMEESNAKLAYTQSDEISLVLLTGPESEPFFGARIQKLCSSLAATASVVFNQKIRNKFPFSSKLATFDCRVWNVPNLVEASNAILWRELDAEKNSVAMQAQSQFSHKALQGKHCEEMKAMCREEGKKPWEVLPVHFQRGSYFKRATRVEQFSAEELSSLPEKHNARKNPGLLFERSQVELVQFPRLLDVSDRVTLLFEDKQNG